MVMVPAIAGADKMRVGSVKKWAMKNIYSGYGSGNASGCDREHGNEDKSGFGSGGGFGSEYIYTLIVGQRL